jgi:hypothetical protein
VIGTVSGTVLGTGTGTEVTAAARVLWGAMVRKGLPVCYQSGPVLSSVLRFMFTLGDNPREIGGDRDRDRGQKRELGKGEVIRPAGGTEWHQVPDPSHLQDVNMNSNHPSLGIQVINCRRLDLPATLPHCKNSTLCAVLLCSILSLSALFCCSALNTVTPHLLTAQACLDSVAVAASAAGPLTLGGLPPYSPIEGIFSELLRLRPFMHDSSEVEDTPRAMLSQVFQSRGDTSDGRVLSEGVEVGLEGLILGAVLSLGGPSSSPGAGSTKEGGSEGCTYRYSSLLRLSLYLSTMPESLLQTLIPALLRRDREWPKVVLKAFSHLYSTRRIALDPRTTYGPAGAGAGSGSGSSATPPLPVAAGKLTLVRTVLEVRQLLQFRIKWRGRILIPLIPYLCLSIQGVRSTISRGAVCPCPCSCPPDGRYPRRGRRGHTSCPFKCRSIWPPHILTGRSTFKALQQPSSDPRPYSGPSHQQLCNTSCCYRPLLQYKALRRCSEESKGSGGKAGDKEEQRSGRGRG